MGSLWIVSSKWVMEVSGVEYTEHCWDRLQLSSNGSSCESIFLPCIHFWSHLKISKLVSWKRSKFVSGKNMFWVTNEQEKTIIFLCYCILQLFTLPSVLPPFLPSLLPFPSFLPFVLNLFQLFLPFWQTFNSFFFFGIFYRICNIPYKWLRKFRIETSNQKKLKNTAAI